MFIKEIDHKQGIKDKKAIANLNKILTEPGYKKLYSLSYGLLRLEYFLIEKYWLSL